MGRENRSSLTHRSIDVESTWIRPAISHWLRTLIIYHFRQTVVQRPDGAGEMRGFILGKPSGRYPGGLIFIPVVSK